MTDNNHDTGNKNLDFWSERYKKEGHIWGDNPSLTGLRLAEVLPPSAKVLEVGFGFGRDILEMLKHGYTVTGVEEASIGLDEAVKQVRDIGKMTQRTGSHARKRAYSAIADISNVASDIQDEMKETNHLTQQSQLISVAQHLGKTEILEKLLGSFSSSSVCLNKDAQGESSLPS